MIGYYVSTVDRYEDRMMVGQIVPDSAWSADIKSESESMEQALKEETEWISSAIEDGHTAKEVISIDTKSGVIWWEDYQGSQYRTEVSIDIAD